MGEANFYYFTCLNEAQSIARDRSFLSELWLKPQGRRRFVSSSVSSSTTYFTMWYEILPSMGLVMGFLYLPQFYAYGWNHLTLNWHNEIRYWNYDNEYYNRDFYHYLRDLRQTGSEYKMGGLEAQPDPCEEKCEEKCEYLAKFVMTDSCQIC